MYIVDRSLPILVLVSPDEMCDSELVVSLVLPVQYLGIRLIIFKNLVCWYNILVLSHRFTQDSW